MSIKVIATVFPAISLVLGVIMIMAGNAGGWLLVLVGAIAQGAWLYMK